MYEPIETALLELWEVNGKMRDRWVGRVNPNYDKIWEQIDRVIVSELCSLIDQSEFRNALVGEEGADDGGASQRINASKPATLDEFGFGKRTARSLGDEAKGSSARECVDDPVALRETDPSIVGVDYKGTRIVRTAVAKS